MSLKTQMAVWKELRRIFRDQEADAYQRFGICYQISHLKMPVSVRGEVKSRVRTAVSKSWHYPYLAPYVNGRDKVRVAFCDRELKRLRGGKK